MEFLHLYLLSVLDDWDLVLHMDFEKCIIERTQVNMEFVCKQEVNQYVGVQVLVCSKVTPAKSSPIEIFPAKWMYAPEIVHCGIASSLFFNHFHV
ncbi:hypothetical protein TorRG33x02_257200 [Trema orientale]|uniref:Uncharacterized protein n=1 Tax=Trema orientale TaxID=63057 RepID=A0A2P5DAP9_TREOI|nr:hypothetical protein TorRG33x02_257200 [Trema orientale]